MHVHIHMHMHMHIHTPNITQYRLHNYFIPVSFAFSWCTYASFGLYLDGFLAGRISHMDSLTQETP